MSVRLVREGRVEFSRRKRNGCNGTTLAAILRDGWHGNGTLFRVINWFSERVDSMVWVEKVGSAHRPPSHWLESPLGVVTPIVLTNQHGCLTVALPTMETG